MTTEPEWISKKAPSSAACPVCATGSPGLRLGAAAEYTRDGNKRAAFLSIGLFLAINGYPLTADQVNAIRAMLAVASGELDMAVKR